MSQLKALPNLPSNNLKRDKKDLIKIASFSDFVENYNSTRANVATQELSSLISLTSNDILQTVRNYDISTNSDVLNKNILNVSEVVKSVSPIELIKLQDTDKAYFSQFVYNLAGYGFSIDTATGNATISIPQGSAGNAYKITIQTLAPTVIKNGTIW